MLNLYCFHAGFDDRKGQVILGLAFGGEGSERGPNAFALRSDIVVPVAAFISPLS
jgi:hypothetical protein